MFNICAYLGVSYKNELSVWALLVEAVYSGSDGVYTLDGRVCVANATTWSLTTACRVVDGFRGSTGVGVQDKVDYNTSGSVSCGSSGLTGTKNVDVRACTLLKLCWSRGSLESEGNKRCREEFLVEHFKTEVIDSQNVFWSGDGGTAFTAPWLYKSLRK